jgi:signal transduction histidine kinase
LGEQLIQEGYKIEIKSKSPIGKVIISERPLVFNDGFQDPRHIPDSKFRGTKSELIVPLKTNQRVLGALDIHSSKSQEFPPDTILIFEMLSDQIALAIEKASIATLVFQTIAREQKFFQFKIQLRNAKEIASTLLAAVLELKQVISPSRVQIILQRPEPQAPTYTNVSGLAVANGEPFNSIEIWTQAAQSSVTSRKIVLKPGIMDPPAVITIPFNFGEYGAGIVEIVEDSHERLWREDELILVAQIAEELSSALESVLLQSAVQQELDQRNRAEEELLRRNQELARLNHIGQEIGKLSDRKEIFKFVYTTIGDLLDNHNLVIALVSSENTISFPIFASNGEIQSIPDKPWENGIPEYVMRSQNPLLINGQATDEYLKLNMDIPRKLPASLIAVPMIAGNRPIGMIMLQDFLSENAYSYIHLELLSTIASQVTAALENVHLLEQLKTSFENLKELDRLKSQFLANMSHELRNPLNSIIGFSRVIMVGIDGPVNETQSQDLNAIYTSGQHLLTLINDVLDLSKIEAGKMELVFSEVDLKEIIPNVMVIAAGFIKDKSITLHHHIPPDLPLLRADPTRIRQVLLNLLSNAAKFTDLGSIIVEASVIDNKSNPDEIIVTVRDTGSGIKPEDHKKLFQPFSQLDDTLIRNSGGTGLGLSICRSLIDLHSGRIGILHSEPRKGSTFFFALPIVPFDPDPLNTKG